MITSPDNKQVKWVVSLLEKAKARKDEDTFVIEGVNLFEEVPADEVKHAFVSESFGETHPKLKEVPYDVVADNIFKKMTDTLTPQGILCVVKKRHYCLEDYLPSKENETPLFVVLETLQDPGNLGTILRTSEGAGVDAVILSKDSVDVYNPKTVRATMGSIFRIPFVYVDDIHAAIKTLKRADVLTYAAHLKGTKSYTEPDYKKATAFLIGNEGNGLTEETANLADTYIKIPMEGKLESLNAAVSTALLIYEAKRQR